ncbi:MAG: hypothetical protein ACE3JK_10435 [Sporolactobacillus sp.]
MENKKVVSLPQFKFQSANSGSKNYSYELEPKKVYNETRSEIAVSKSSGGDDGMDEKYVTQREFDNTIGSLRKEFDLHFDTISEKFERINDKIESSKRDTIHEIKELIHNQNDQQQKTKSQTIKWIIGTFGMGTLSIIVAIVLHFI